MLKRRTKLWEEDGASSGNKKITASDRQAYEKYVAERLNDKEYIRANNPGLFSMKYPEEFINDYKKGKR